jgi:hypothetical protein
MTCASLRCLLGIHRLRPEPAPWLASWFLLVDRRCGRCGADATGGWLYRLLSRWGTP